MTNERPLLLLKLVGIGSLLAWCYWACFGELVVRWAEDPEYAHGYFVIAFSGFVLWLRRGSFPHRPLHGSGWGLLVMAMAVAIRFGSGGFSIPLELASAIACLAGGCWALGGWALYRWALPAILLLLFLLPLPPEIEEELASWLRPGAMGASAYMMQTLGLAAIAERKILVVNASGVQMFEASSGLDAIVTLLALTATIICIRSSDHWQKAVILLSAIPIALALNVVRITLTVVLYEILGSAAADLFFHYLAGWALLPAALGVLWMECWVLDHLICEVDSRVRPLWSFKLASPLTSAGAMQS